MQQANMGAILKMMRKQKGLTQTQMGALLGCNKPTISKLESRGNRMIFTTAVKYIKMLGYKVSLRSSGNRITIEIK